MSAASAQVMLVCGPSGSGKTHLAARAGLPWLHLDDFYKTGDDPTLPRLPDGLVDWDSVDSWHGEAAFAAIQSLCAEGRADIPVYDIPADAIVGVRELHLGESRVFLAEGLFAGSLIARCREAGLLADAVCLRRAPAATFVRRLVRDLREHRKPVQVLIRRGWRLMRADADDVARFVGQGARPVRMGEAVRVVQRCTTTRQPV